MPDWDVIWKGEDRQVEVLCCCSGFVLWCYLYLRFGLCFFQKQCCFMSLFQVDKVIKGCLGNQKPRRTSWLAKGTAGQQQQGQDSGDLLCFSSICKLLGYASFPRFHPFLSSSLLHCLIEINMEKIKTTHILVNTPSFCKLDNFVMMSFFHSFWSIFN